MNHWNRFASYAAISIIGFVGGAVASTPGNTFIFIPTLVISVGLAVMFTSDGEGW